MHYFMVTKKHVIPTDEDKVPLTGLPVLGETPTYFEVSIGLTNVGGCAASAREFIN